MEASSSDSSTTRRNLLGVSLIGGVAFAAKVAPAQQLILPDLEETLAFLSRAEGMGLLYSRFGLAEAITRDLVARLTGTTLSNLEVAPAVGLLPLDQRRMGRQDASQLLGFIQSIVYVEGTAEPVSSELEAISSILSERGDPLAGNRRESLAGLLERIRIGLEDSGLATNQGAIADALSSCGHIERILSVRQDTTTSSALCTFFPFNYFCG